MHSQIYSLADFYDISISGGEFEEAVGGLCPSRNDLTRAFLNRGSETGPRVFYTSVTEGIVNFNNPFCLGFTAETTNPSNSAPLATIIIPGVITPALSLVLDGNGVNLTIGGVSASFPGAQFSTGTQELQICTTTTTATLYSNCGLVQTIPFSGYSIDDISASLLFILTDILGSEVFEVSVSYLLCTIKTMHDSIRRELSSIVITCLKKIA